MTRARRASRPRFRLLPTLLLTLAILGVPTVVYALGRSSSSFDIVHVRVAGTHLVPDKRALRLLTRDYSGRNLFTVTGGDVRKTLAPLRLIADATVDRDFPDTLSVRITEYAPAAYALAGERWYVLDESGYVICTAAEAADQLTAAKKRAAGASASPSASVSPSASASATPAPGETAAGATDAAGTTDARERPTRQERPTRRLPAPAAPRPSASSRAPRTPSCSCPASPSPAGSGRESSSTTRRPPTRSARSPRCPALCDASWPQCRTRTGSSPCASPVVRSPSGATLSGRSPRRWRCARCWPSMRMRGRPALCWTSRSPTGRSPSRCSSDGRDSLQPLVEPGAAGSPTRALFDTPKGRGYGKSTVGSPGLADRFRFVRIAAN